MRSNGLTAEDYAAVAELERSVAADALLALRDAGVAAYAVPLEHGQTPEHDHGQTPEHDHGQHPEQHHAQARQHPPRSTLFADRTALDRARVIVRGLDPDAVPAVEVSPVDEVAWQQIVSGFSATATEPEHERRLLDEPDRRPREEPDRPDRDRTAPPPRREPHPLVRDDDDRFVPEPPAPAPRLDWVSRLAWTGVLGSPLALTAAALISWAPPRFLVLLCVIGFVGGMVTLVLRMKDRPPNDGGPDNGAVV